MSVGLPTGTPQAVVTRQKLELTEKIVAQIKEELTQAGLPPKIYKFTYDGDEFVFRPLYRKDWNEVQAYIRDNQDKLTQDLIDEKICRTGVIFPDTALHPVQWEIQRAGYQSSLAKLILAKSGFFDPDVDQSDILRVETLGSSERGPKPPAEVEEELKARFNWPLKLVLAGDDWYVVRPLTRGEWKRIQKGEEEDLDLATVQLATIWSRNYPEPPAFEDQLAGTVRVLSEVIMQASGFMIQPAVEEL